MPANISIGPESASNPCVIAGTNCPQNGIPFTNFGNTGGVSSYDSTSPIYTVGQLTNIVGTSFNIVVDMNTADHEESLTLFRVTVGGSSLYEFTAATNSHNIGNGFHQGNGFADYLLSTVNLSGFAANVTVVFQAVFDHASDGAKSFFLTAQSAPVPGPIAGAGLPGIVMACGGLLALARRRRIQIARSASASSATYKTYNKRAGLVASALCF